MNLWLRLCAAWRAFWRDPRAPIVVQFGPRRVDLRRIKPDDIDIATMARALAAQPRWNGQTVRHYSVAEHSLAVASRVPPEHQLWALLHDAAEAFMGDLITPIKRHDDLFRELEANIMRAVCERWQLPYDMPEEVHVADMREQAREARDILPFPPAKRTLPPYDDRIGLTDRNMREVELHFHAMLTELVRNRPPSEIVDRALT